jgi:hypothetical protein
VPAPPKTLGVITVVPNGSVAGGNEKVNVAAWPTWISSSGDMVYVVGRTTPKTEIDGVADSPEGDTVIVARARDAGVNVNVFASPAPPHVRLVGENVPPMSDERDAVPA